MLISNIMFLRENYPEIRNYFREHEDKLNLNNIEVLDSKSNTKTLNYHTTDNGKFMVHSGYDPIKEAERIISTHKEKIDSNTHVFFYGVGLGYHIQKFKEMFPNNSYSIYEPIPEIFLTMANLVDIEALNSTKLNNIYIDRHDVDSSSFLEEFKVSNTNIHIIILPSYENFVKERVSDFHQKVKNTVQSRRTYLQTNINFQKLWVKNGIQNFETVLNTPNALRDISTQVFSDKPAIIVSAGPSLADDIEYLKVIKNKNLAYIFSVGSAINTLIEYDIMPDAICTYDPTPYNHLVFSKLIEKGKNNIPMIFGSSVENEILNTYKGPKVHFITTQDSTSNYFLDGEFDKHNEIILDSPSIAVIALQLLIKLGSNPIIFAGQNLGYHDNRIYSKGIEYEHINSELDEATLENALTTTDVYGNIIKTNRGFNLMRENIEHFIRLNKNKTFINTTKGGAAIEGVPFKPIEDVIDILLNTTIEKQTWWERDSSYDKVKINQSVNKLKSSINRYLEITSKINETLNSLNNAIRLKNFNKIEEGLISIEKNYTNLKNNDYFSDFLSSYVRVQLEFLVNEINSVKHEKDLFSKGDKIYRAFSDFVNRCNQGHDELIIVLKTYLIDELSK
ncbi:motility associated factor glycosyltransferase family protein [Paucisalibacillus globulus]|uniref:motility associated factor glycosyltransferase family protein n=1 Tax=Paucisalibacillus globulus TaxID=351095 RepID=UPI000404D241|nr:6-hydroxymethylpterin diphosphokinase MptE-like protein [Paucisalibacillus globulus]